MTPNPGQPTRDDGTTLLPFIVCRGDGGGPYDNASFAAGWLAGAIHTALGTAYTAGFDRAGPWDVPAPLLPQLELIGMDRGFPTMHAAAPGPDGAVQVRFVRAADDD